ncbi:hypothetical protein NC652_027582 [Populus alba x Populus x berolinensis]|nr:hypothetical protein NC652_027582 [Populus alba x Populus x berolinensis]
MAMKNVNIPKAPKVASTLATIGPIGLYAVFNSLNTVEGWHRAVMFNSIYEVKEKGEAKTAEVISQAMANNQSFLSPRKIEAAREIALVISNAKNKVC